MYTWSSSPFPATFIGRRSITSRRPPDRMPWLARAAQVQLGSGQPDAQTQVLFSDSLGHLSVPGYPTRSSDFVIGRNANIFPHHDVAKGRLVLAQNGLARLGRSPPEVRIRHVLEREPAATVPRRLRHELSFREVALRRVFLSRAVLRLADEESERRQARNDDGCGNLLSAIVHRACTEPRRAHLFLPVLASSVE